MHAIELYNKTILTVHVQMHFFINKKVNNRFEPGIVHRYDTLTQSVFQNGPLILVC